MTYMLQATGDDESGPVTTPRQVEHNDSIIVGDVGAKRVQCYELPADSPFRQPGQACAPSSAFMDTLKSLWDGIAGSVPTVAPTAPTPPADSGPPWALILGGAAVGAYFIYKRKKK